MEIRLTSNMSAEEMLPLWPGIVRCLEKYCARFNDETPENIIAECAQGKRQLWVCLDGGTVVLTPVTEIVTINATGRKRLLLAEVAGERLDECMPLLREIEAWAKDQGAETSQLVGRDGWAKVLPAFGYAPKARIFEKAL
ncbi:hypothetical protein FJ973_29650 [Mesorhizobium sp. B2-1-3]|uniref:hypothetical protein n=1 Tax=Mesorhizobium sp. B2-1-3 TaxID=2589972 RepID=UPI0011280D92|nr:hypothetical protein [Mesorhizobium sp. B2-1-3]TPN03810.1 hypothetical protein FJ973_29650 [Mesorhizobium sp. B2-1-3]